MYYWEFYYIENVRKLCLRKAELVVRSKEYMQGYLVSITKKSGRKEWYCNNYRNGIRSKKYLSSKKDKLIIDALQKKHQEYPSIKKELQQIECLCKTLLPTARKILSEIDILPKKYPPFMSQNPNHPEWLKYITTRGEKVRSISERIIADTFYKYGIDYKYEKTLTFNGADLHPDFTIVSPLSGTVYYWEHLGLNTEEYIKSWHKRLALYAENNINIGKNLIVSTQGDINRVDAIIREYFTMERYKVITG